MQKRATIKDVAALAGVGTSVVSYVLNDTPGKSLPIDTRQRVKDAARRLDYIPNSIARGMRSSKTMVLGVLSFWKGNGTIFNDILDGVVDRTAQSDYSVMLCKNEGEFGYIDYYLKKRVDGFILLAPPADHVDEFIEQEHVARLKEKDVPYVIINGQDGRVDGDNLYLDHFKSAFVATQYLIDLGHERIGYVESRPNPGFINTKKIEGFCSAMKKNGLDGSRILYMNDLDVIDVIDNLKITGLVAHYCGVAHEILNQAIDLNISIPQQLSVIATNTHSYAPYLHPPLTTVKFPTIQLGISATEILLNKINKTEQFGGVELPHLVCERESCRRI